jgi:hypothetical protein
MTPERMGICLLFGVAALAALAWATSNDGLQSIPVPEFESEAQFAGVGLSAGQDSSNLLTTDWRVHFWAPGYNPRDKQMSVSAQPISVKVRYPALSGTNVSTVMHRGWSGFQQCSPDKDWFYMPPEAAVI